MADDPYSRQYWRFIDEFPEIYSDDAAFALWGRLLITADMAWPSSAPLPKCKPKALAVLVAVSLVELLPAYRFRIPSMDKHRNARSNAARTAVEARWKYARNTDAIPSRAEPSLDKTSLTVVQRPNEGNGLAPVRAVLEQAGVLPPKETT